MPPRERSTIRFAHTAPEGKPWEPLSTHLQQVGDRAARFCAGFGSEAWGKLAGLWHDLGKYSDEFQVYLRSSQGDDLHQAELRGTVDHSTAGAQHAMEQLGRAHGSILAYLIAGHHAGLADWLDFEGRSGLTDRLAKEVPQWREHAPPSLLNRPRPDAPPLPKPADGVQAGFRTAFWIRMLFSALCDADFLATESFMSPDRAAARPDRKPSVEELLRVLDSHMRTLSNAAPDTPMNRLRARVLEACEDRAEEAPGFFALNVPTGGGKTLASMVFALRHALRHGQLRIVVGIPFTSIIEQNADIYRATFSELGEGVILEHHSSLDPNRDSVLHRLQSENWDAPIVVTTNVQLFESMFASRPRACRKLHNLANSVVILDEVQTLPVDLLRPTLLALQELVQVYGCSVVLCSATQPALLARDNFAIGLPPDKVRPILQEPESLQGDLNRHRVAVEGVVPDEDLLARVLDRECVLVVVNTTSHARRLVEMLGDAPGHFHLSARMCPAHRVEILEQIRQRLSKGEVCRVISTQLVEAGVDLDFEVVYRARCGLDSLAQAAGRCNREGLRTSGEVVFFATEELPPPGALRETAQIAEELLGDHADPLSEAAVTQYFEHYYWRRSHAWDRREVLACLPSGSGLQFQFRTMARRYRFIPDEACPILVPWSKTGEALAGRARASEGPDRTLRRALQRYQVSVRPHVRDALEKQAAVESHCDLLFLSQSDLYHPRWGLQIERITGRRSPEDNIV